MVTIQIGLGLALLLPFWVAAIGWLSGRLLGVRLGRLRAAVAATIGWVIGLVATAVVLSGEHIDAWAFLLLVCFFAVLATMPLRWRTSCAPAVSACGPSAMRVAIVSWWSSG